MNLAAQRLFEATGLSWQAAGRRIVAARERYTKQWAAELAEEVSRKLQPA